MRLERYFLVTPVSSGSASLHEMTRGKMMWGAVTSDGIDHWQVAVIRKLSIAQRRLFHTFIVFDTG